MVLTVRGLMLASACVATAACGQVHVVEVQPVSIGLDERAAGTVHEIADVAPVGADSVDIIFRLDEPETGGAQQNTCLFSELSRTQQTAVLVVLRRAGARETLASLPPLPDDEISGEGITRPTETNYRGRAFARVRKPTADLALLERDPLLVGSQGTPEAIRQCPTPDSFALFDMYALTVRSESRSGAFAGGVLLGAFAVVLLAEWRR